MTGRLFVVATPIGNLEDMTLRAIRTLREADLVLAEDTRHTRTLLAHHQIATRMMALHAHTPPPRIAELAEQLAGGQTFALVTDAGTPLVSDPGAELVRAAIERGVTITPIPGASAPLAALVASGLGGASFEFLGFLARSGGKRRDQLAHVAKSTAAVVLFESPNRLVATLSDLAGVIGARPVAVCRELTKLHEEIARGGAAELAARFAEGVRGEITIVVGAADAADATPEPPDDEAVDAAIDRLLDDGSSARDAADAIAGSLGLPRRDAYQRVLARRAVRGDSGT
jgi:16S rRNA (cytidine1402-2'-O)-methyltransferase